MVERVAVEKRPISSACLTCGAECCHKWSFQARVGGRLRELLEMHYGRAIETVRFKVYHKCEHVTADGLCDLWKADPAEDTRPAICQEFSCEKMDDPGLLILPLTGVDLDL